MRAGMTTALEARLRRPDATARPIVIAQTVERNADGTLRQHIRQRRDQWGEADGASAGPPATHPDFDFFDEGDVRLKDTIATHVDYTTSTTNITDLDRLTPWKVPIIEWADALPADFEIDRLQLYLNPRVNGGLNWNVRVWRVELMYAAQILREGYNSGVGVDWYTFAPLCEPIDMAVVSQAAGLVSFNFGELPVRPRPKAAPTAVIDPEGAPTPPALLGATLVFVYALTETGEAASNVGLGYDSGTSSHTQNGTRILVRDIVKDDARLLHTAGNSIGTPRLKIELGTYAEETLSFTSGNLFDLGSAPADDVQLVLRGSVPVGCELVGEVRNDADSGWVTFIDGQWMIADLGLTPTQTRKMQVTLSPNGAGNLTPTLTGLGMAAFAETYLGDVATVEGGDWAIDPVTLRGEIPEVRITGIRDGMRDYADAITELLATNHIGNILLRLYWGDAVLPRHQWLHVDDFLIDGSHPRGPDLTLKCLSVLSLLRDMVPRFEPGEVVAPDGDNTVGAWSDEGGAISNLYQSIDETTFDDTDYVRSNTSPNNSQYIMTLGTPVDPLERRHTIDYRYWKDSASGEQINLTVELRQGTTPLASQSHNDISEQPTAGSFALTPDQVAAITDYADLRVRLVAHTPSAGTGRRAIVSWVRLRIGGKRDPVTFLGSSLQDTYDELIQNHLALDARYQGPGVTDATTAVSKVISVPSRAGKPTSKAEVDAIAHLAGGGVISSQGRVTFRELYGQRPVRTVFPASEILMEQAGPGYEDRVPEYFVKWRWNEDDGDFDEELRVFHAGALTNLGLARLQPPRVLDDEISKWIADESLANTVGDRHVVAIGPGLLEWTFRSNYPYPELEPGDLVAVQTDQFVARDPNAGAALRGALWARGVVRAVDASARRFTIWIRNYADILSSADGKPGKQFPKPNRGDLLVNGDWESGLDWWGHSTTPGVPASLETGADRYAGAASLRLEQLGNEFVSLEFMTQAQGGQVARLSVEPGTVLRVSAAAKWDSLPGGSPNANLTVSWYDDLGVLISSDQPVSWTTETAWTEKTGYIRLPPTAYFISVAAHLELNPLTAGVAFFDDLHVFRVANTPDVSLEESVGGGSVSLGSNSPGSGTPVTWLHFTAQDGTTVYVPAWQ